MLQRLEIQNFALIENLEISFQEGFTTITGETGSGKSVILSALGLLLGKRADSKILKNMDQKCVVLGEFSIKNYTLEIQNEDLKDVVVEEDTLRIRRVILPSGKSRAYVNEEPVKLEDLKILGAQLVDIHSQHENMLVRDVNFAREVVDQFAGNEDLLEEYQNAYSMWRVACHKYEEIVAQQEQAKADYEYNLHQLEAFEGIEENLDLSALESEQEMGAHGVEIEEGVKGIGEGIGKGENALDEILSVLNSLKNFYEPAQNWKERVESLYLELQEIKREVESRQGSVNLDPERVEYVSHVLGQVYGLMKRYNVNDLAGLWKVKKGLEEKVKMVNNFEEVLEESQRESEVARQQVEILAEKLSMKRQEVIPELEKQIESQLRFLGMEDAVVVISREELTKKKEEPDIEFGPYGIDHLEFSYAAHANLPVRPLGQIGSGGEMARVMLVLKNILAQRVSLPTIIFDEIDTGVSGEIADKVGQMMERMAENRQVFGITHLPQVAAKGDHQFKVLKEGDAVSAYTRIVRLGDEDRTAEIAQMISGQSVTESALMQARELLRS